MANPSPTGREIVQAVRKALRSVSGSDELLTHSQLLAVRTEINNALTFVNTQIQVEELFDRKVVLDLSDWESASDEEEDGDERMGAETGGSENGDGGENRDGSESRYKSPKIPLPYPIYPPGADEIPVFWYVVDCGREVGIFASEDSAEDAITGVDGGHHIRLRCWYDAAMMYNTLYLQGNIVLVNV